MEGHNDDPPMSMAKRQMQAVAEELTCENEINHQETTFQNQELMQTLYKEIQTPSQIVHNNDQPPPRDEEGEESRCLWDHEAGGSWQDP